MFQLQSLKRHHHSIHIENTMSLINLMNEEMDILEIKIGDMTNPKDGHRQEKNITSRIIGIGTNAVMVIAPVIKIMASVNPVGLEDRHRLRITIMADHHQDRQGKGVEVEAADHRVGEEERHHHLGIKNGYFTFYRNILY